MAASCSRPSVRPEVAGADATHFNRPTYIDWLPDGTFFVSDGYTGTRVAKFDKNGKFLMDWGKLGGPPRGPIDTRPGYFSNVHGVAVDPATHHVFVNDRNNHRIQVFDENGKYLYEWKIDADPSSLHLLYIGSGKTIWTFRPHHQQNGGVGSARTPALLLGQHGRFPGRLWGVHGMSVDQEGNLYVAEVDAGRVQKFHPKAGANPDSWSRSRSIRPGSEAAGIRASMRCWATDHRNKIVRTNPARKGRTDFLGRHGQVARGGAALLV